MERLNYMLRTTGSLSHEDGGPTMQEIVGRIVNVLSQKKIAIDVLPGGTPSPLLFSCFAGEGAGRIVPERSGLGGLRLILYFKNENSHPRWMGKA